MLKVRLTIKSAQTEAILRALADRDVDKALSVVAGNSRGFCGGFSVALDDVLMQFITYLCSLRLMPWRPQMPMHAYYQCRSSDTGRNLAVFFIKSAD
jgi:hypothetical protein